MPLNPIEDPPEGSNDAWAGGMGTTEYGCGFGEGCVTDIGGHFRPGGDLNSAFGVMLGSEMSYVNISVQGTLEVM